MNTAMSTPLPLLALLSMPSLTLAIYAEEPTNMQKNTDTTKPRGAVLLLKDSCFPFGLHKRN